MGRSCIVLFQTDQIIAFMNQRLERLKEMEKQKPEEGFLKFAIAQEYINAGNDAEAQPYFEFLLNEQPGYVPTYYHAGKLYERLQNAEKAADTYRRGIIVAKTANDAKTAGELNEALSMLVD